MLAVLRGELAATSFGGEVYLAALFLSSQAFCGISATTGEGYFVADQA
jgi:hypothetical protein